MCQVSAVRHRRSSGRSNGSMTTRNSARNDSTASRSGVASEPRTHRPRAGPAGTAGRRAGREAGTRAVRPRGRWSGPRHRDLRTVCVLPARRKLMAPASSQVKDTAVLASPITRMRQLARAGFPPRALHTCSSANLTARRGPHRDRQTRRATVNPSPAWLSSGPGTPSAGQEGPVPSLGDGPPARDPTRIATPPRSPATGRASPALPRPATTQKETTSERAHRIQQIPTEETAVF
jgi:hypothetical protein